MVLTSIKYNLFSCGIQKVREIGKKLIFVVQHRLSAVLGAALLLLFGSQKTWNKTEKLFKMSIFFFLLQGILLPGKVYILAVRFKSLITKIFTQVGFIGSYDCQNIIKSDGLNLGSCVFRPKIECQKRIRNEFFFSY